MVRLSTIVPTLLWVQHARPPSSAAPIPSVRRTRQRPPLWRRQKSRPKPTRPARVTAQKVRQPVLTARQDYLRAGSSARHRSGLSTPGASDVRTLLGPRLSDRLEARRSSHGPLTCGARSYRAAMHDQRAEHVHVSLTGRWDEAAAGLLLAWSSAGGWSASTPAVATRAWLEVPGPQHRRSLLPRAGRPGSPVLRASSKRYSSASSMKLSVPAPTRTHFGRLRQERGTETRTVSSA